MIYKNYLKRIIDLVGSFLLLIFVSPLLLIVSILIKLESEGPLFFIQERVGKNLSSFRVLKFRTMTDEEREISRIVGKADGVTKVGYYLRRFKIDELPQLFNVLKGDMSLIGPRPSIFAQLEDMSDGQKKRYSVRPGMTGLAQVSGNIHLSWEERFIHDLKYVHNISFINDLKILFRTVLIIFKGEENFVDNPLRIKDST